MKQTSNGHRKSVIDEPIDGPEYPAAAVQGSRLAVFGLAFVACISCAPLLFEARPVEFARPYASAATDLAAKAAVILVLAGAGVVAAGTLRRQERHPYLLVIGLAGLSGLMTGWHWLAIDMARLAVPDPRGGLHFFYPSDWQRELYLAVLNGQKENPQDGFVAIPHVFRPLPYGFTRSLELVTGDWRFASMAYRWFFNYWFVWGFYRFVRVFRGARLSALALLVLVPLYPLSIRYYQGQLTDPMSHALFALSLRYAVCNCVVPLAVSLGLGVLAKETVVVIVPGYLACWWRRGLRALLTGAVLLLVCVAAFLAARLPLGWNLRFESVNGTSGWMITSNLGIGNPPYRAKPAMLRENYLQPLWFIGIFVPFIIARWKQIDRRLKGLFLTLTPLLLLSNLCFGWLYESRNYVPLLPILTAMAIPDPRPARQTPAVGG